MIEAQRRGLEDHDFCPFSKPKQFDDAMDAGLGGLPMSAVRFDCSEYTVLGDKKGLGVVNCSRYFVTNCNIVNFI